MGLFEGVVPLHYTGRPETADPIRGRLTFFYVGRYALNKLSEELLRPQPNFQTYEERLGPQPDIATIQQVSHEHNVQFLRLTFTDILGHTKNVEVPMTQLEKALEGNVMFDGSSIEGFARVEESDMVLKPDLSTFRIFPWGHSRARVARVICDVAQPSGEPFPGDPRFVLQRAIRQAEQMDMEMMAGVEAEFFLFHRNDRGEPTTRTHDRGGYFDLTPVDQGEKARRVMTARLEAMGFEVEAAHHEVAPGQHEIDFKYDTALQTADDLATFRFVVRSTAHEFGLHATFMPKPLQQHNGSGLHTHQSLFREGDNLFYDADAEDGLSDVMRYYIGGLKQHARAMAAVTNPLVNSYKRLVPGYEAPVNIAWSRRNRSPLIRVPERRQEGTRVEFRMPDPACNPYLALAVQLQAGLEGVRNRRDPGPDVRGNVWEMSPEQRKKLDIRQLPANLGEALGSLQEDEIIQEALGNHVLAHLTAAQQAEWEDYRAQVTSWELQEYLATY